MTMSMHLSRMLAVANTLNHPDSLTCTLQHHLLENVNLSTSFTSGQRFQLSHKAVKPICIRRNYPYCQGLHLCSAVLICSTLGARLIGVEMLCCVLSVTETHIPFPKNDACESLLAFFGCVSGPGHDCEFLLWIQVSYEQQMTCLNDSESLTLFWNILAHIGFWFKRDLPPLNQTKFPDTSAEPE